MSKPRSKQKPATKGATKRPNKAKAITAKAIHLPTQKPTLFHRVKAILSPTHESRITNHESLSEVRSQVLQALHEREAQHPHNLHPQLFSSPALSAAPTKKRRWIWPLLILAGLGCLAYWGGSAPTPTLTIIGQPTHIAQPNTAITITNVFKVSSTSSTLTLAATLKNNTAQPLTNIQVGILVADAAGRPLKAVSTAISSTLVPYGQLSQTFTTAINPATPQRYLLSLPLSAFQLQPLILSAAPAL